MTVPLLTGLMCIVVGVMLAVEAWMKIRSELAISATAALRAAGVTMR